MKGELTIKVIRGTTGRSGFHLVADAPTAHVAVQAFVLEVCASLTQPNWAELIESNPVAAAIARDVESTVSIGLSGSFWRARAFANLATRPSPDQFGAPPEGRYNPPGSRVLYLASDALTAAAECSGRSDAREVWVQEFDLNVPDARAIRLDMNLEKQHQHLHYLLLDCEYLPDAAAEFPNVRNPYRATHFLTFLREVLGVSAVEYPSIRRGMNGPKGTSNLVLLGQAVPLVEKMTVGWPVLSDVEPSVAV